MKCEIIADKSGLAIITPYNPDFVSDLKRYIPATERRWDGENKRWTVTARHGVKVQELITRVYGELVLLPTVAQSKPVTVSKILEVKYIGATKDRGSDERSSYGFYNGGWNVLFPESVLKKWFDATDYPDEAQNLYSVLGVKRDATEEEIKSGYRRMVMQWHPDRCKEQNAQDQFMAIQHAYDVLKVNREKYDAGLALEASINANFDKGSSFRLDSLPQNGYRSPLRCGLIMCDGADILGVFNVSKIFAWQDITDSNGRVLVVSWGLGDKKFTEVWA